MTREDYKNMKLNESNISDTYFLDWVTGERHDIIKKLMLEVDFDYPKNDKTVDVIFPCIIRIINQIYDGANQRCEFKIDKTLIGKVMELININDIINKLDDCLPIIYETLNMCFHYLDYECETIALFCENYVMGLIKEV